MARPTKEGLDYFSFDTDFYDNKKVRKIMRACGPGAGTILTCLLCNIYKDKGYYILWEEDMPFDIADKIGVSEGAVSEMVNKALQVDFFDTEIFKKFKILTSHEIQKRYKAGTSKRLDVSFDDRFLINGKKNKVIDAGNNISSTINGQSKVKESTVNESKEKNRAKALVGGADENDQMELKNKYKALVENLDSTPPKEVWILIKDFISVNNPQFAEPYVDIWNIFAMTYKLPKFDIISDSRRKKFKTRFSEKGFDFIAVLEKIKTSAHLKGDNKTGWNVTLDWIIENDKNYLKILEGNYN
jgi:hypothetical protein